MHVCCSLTLCHIHHRAVGYPLYHTGDISTQKVESDEICQLISNFILKLDLHTSEPLYKDTPENEEFPKMLESALCPYNL